MMNSRHFLLVALVLVSVIYFQPALQQMDDVWYKTGEMSGQSSDCPNNYELINKYADEPSE